MDKKVVLVTGASGGIGKAIAAHFIKKNYHVVLNCKSNIKNLIPIKNAYESENPNILCIQADVSDYAQVKDLFLQAEKQWRKPVDILINNAGIAKVGLFTDSTPEEWEQLVNINLKGVFNCCHLAIPAMVSKKQGHIINISSIWGHTGASCEAVYAATKGGINAFTRSLAKELAPCNIQINGIACGAIDTKMNNFLSPDEKNAFADGIPMGRFGNPEEVAALAYILAENKMPYLTGQIITLDGGLT